MVSKLLTISTSASMSSTMASTSSSSTMAPSTITTPLNLMNQPLTLLSNMTNIMTFKLDSTNYIMWKHQITIMLDTYSMFELLNQAQLFYEKFLKDLSRNFNIILNPSYQI